MSAGGDGVGNGESEGDGVGARDLGAHDPPPPGWYHATIGVGVPRVQAAERTAARPPEFGLPTPRRGGGAWAFLLAIATAGALAHVGVRFKGMEVAYALGRERRVSGELEEQRRRLQIEIGMLKDPNRVVAIARDRLGMGPPAPEAIRRLGTGTLFVGSGAAPANANASVATTAPAPAPAARAASAAGQAAASGTTASNRGAR